MAVGSKKTAEHVAVVTGAASGMGRAMACEGAAQGVQAIAIDVQADVAELLRKEETCSGWDLLGIVADLSDTADCERAASTALHANFERRHPKSGAAIYERRRRDVTPNSPVSAGD